MTTSTIENGKWTRDDLEKMSINDLKELCESIKLSKTGKKTILIDRLMNCSGEGMVMATTPSMPPQSSLDNDNEDEDNDNTGCAFTYDYSSD